MIGIERGWSLRGAAPGTRVAGVRTYTLIGASGGVAALLGTLVDPAITVTLALAIAAVMVAGYWRQDESADATSFMAAIVALSLGLLRGGDRCWRAGGSVAMRVLASRAQSPGFVRISRTGFRIVPAPTQCRRGRVRSFRTAIWPVDSWNRSSVAGRPFGHRFPSLPACRKPPLVRKRRPGDGLIGVAYSSTAVRRRLPQARAGEPGPLAAGSPCHRRDCTFASSSRARFRPPLLRIPPCHAPQRRGCMSPCGVKRAPPSGRTRRRCPALRRTRSHCFVLIVALRPS